MIHYDFEGKESPVPVQEDYGFKVVLSFIEVRKAIVVESGRSLPLFMEMTHEL